MTVEWPTKVREAAWRALSNNVDSDEMLIDTCEHVIDAVLNALSDHMQPRTDDWEWSNRRPDGYVHPPVNESRARAFQSMMQSGGLVRRRPAGEWEVAP